MSYKDDHYVTLLFIREYLTKIHLTSLTHSTLVIFHMLPDLVVDCFVYFISVRFSQNLLCT